MARILCIDYGLKRTGVAVTDPLKIIASGLTALDTKDVLPFLKNYFQQEQVELILLGEPKNLDDTDTHATSLVNEFQKKLQKEFPSIPDLASPNNAQHRSGPWALSKNML